MSRMPTTYDEMIRLAWAVGWRFGLIVIAGKLAAVLDALSSYLRHAG